MRCRQILVVETLDIFDMQELEDVVYTGDKLHVRPLGVHDIATLRELPQFWVIDILRQQWIVLVGKVAPQTFHTNILSPLQLLEQRYAVEDFAVKVPADI